MTNELFYNESIRRLLGEVAALSLPAGPLELCCIWFDDLYLPGQSPPEGYPLDTWERGQREWKACFDDLEIHVLYEFHKVWASEIDDLPVTGEWRQHPGWKKVSEAARAALDQLGRSAYRDD